MRSEEFRDLGYVIARGLITRKEMAVVSEEANRAFARNDLIDSASYFSTGTVDTKGRADIVTNQVMPLPRADVRCIDVKTGDEKWNKKGLGYFHVGLIALADGKLLTLDDAGTLLLAEPGETEFKELAKASVCGGTFCNPVLSNGYLYVRDAALVACYNLKEPAAGNDKDSADEKPDAKVDDPRKPKLDANKPDDDVLENGQ